MVKIIPTVNTDIASLGLCTKPAYIQITSIVFLTIDAVIKQLYRNPGVVPARGQNGKEKLPETTKKKSQEKP